MLVLTRPLQETQSKGPSTVRLEDLFDSSRIQVKPKLYKALLYFPVALCLLLVRLFAAIWGFMILTLLPKTSQKRSAIVKWMCKVFGLVVEIDNKYEDESAKLLVANHASLLDRLAVNVMVPCSTITHDFSVGSIDSFSFWKDIDMRYTQDLTNEEIEVLQKYIEESPIPVLHFPESATTNTKAGLLKFHPGIFSLNSPVQPVLVHVSLSSFMTVSPSVLGSTIWADVLWCFMLPSTFFKLKVLPSMVKLPGESAAEFSKRVQHSMAQAMNLTPTIYTSSDKTELVKQWQAAITMADSSSRNITVSTNLSNPHHSSNLLKSKYTANIPYQELTMNTAAETFGRSPKDRMASYQERKAILMEAARQKYLHKIAMKTISVDATEV